MTTLPRSMELDSVNRFDSGVALLTYLSAP